MKLFNNGNRVSLVAAIAVAGATALAAAEELDNGDKFALWNDCKPISVQVGVDPNDGVTEEDVLAVVNSKLRSARLYEDTLSSGQWLWVSVEVGHHNGSYVGLRLYRHLLTLPYSDGGQSVEALDGWAATWQIGSFGFIGSYSPEVEYEKMRARRYMEAGLPFHAREIIRQLHAKGIDAFGAKNPNDQVLTVVSGMTNRFIDEYLRVNADAC